jgi:uncharacterized membrane protein YhiD involved in acid resistance
MNEIIDLNLIYSDQDILEFFVLLLWAIGLSLLVRAYYVHFLHKVVGMSSISNIIPLIAITTFLVIMIVKSSLALSLGLVGALSIVRFRAPIKDPMELTFIFMAIAIGIGLGAAKPEITALTIIIALVVDMIRQRLGKKQHKEQTLLLEFSRSAEPGSEMVRAVDVLKQFDNRVGLTRVDIGEDGFSLVAHVGIDAIDQLDRIMGDLQKINSTATGSLFDSKTIW